MKRLAFLIGFLVCELLAVYSLRTSGWSGTGDRIHLIFAVGIALLPLVAAVGILLMRGRRFSLRSMMIATALFAIFISLILIPYTGVQNRRRGVMALDAARIPYRTESYLAEGYLRQNIPFPFEPESATRTSDDISFWMVPLLGDSLPTYPDRAVRSLELLTDADVNAVAPLLSRFPNLEHVRLSGPVGGLSGVSKASMKQFAERFPALEAVAVDVDLIPEGWGRSLRGIRGLHVNAAWPRNSLIPLSDDQLDDLLAVKGLEFLTFDGIDINDENVERIAKLPSLKHLSLWRADVTEPRIKAIREKYPELELRDGPHDLTPEYFLHTGGLNKSNAEIRIVYNENREEWGRRFLRGANRLVYYGEGGQPIDTAFPIEIEIRAPDESDPVFIMRKLHALRRFGGHKKLAELSSNQSTFDAAITFAAADAVGEN